MNQKQIDDIIDGVFSAAEFATLNSLITADVKTLNKYGYTSFSSQEADGVVTETLTFISKADPTQTFTRVNSYHKTDDLFKVVQLINKKLEQAIAREDYMLAAKLKLQKEELLFNQEK